MLALITGGSSGLGACIKRRLSADGYGYTQVKDMSLETNFDVTDEADVQHWANEISATYGRADFLINCAGYNYLNWIEEIPDHEWDRVMNVNARGLFFMAKYFASLLRGGTICNVVSNASHMPMTHSLAYNASKGAAAIMTRQMARELWATHNITVFGVSPNKLKHTGMTEHVDRRAAELRGMTSIEAREYQLTKLFTGEETDPDCVAEFIVWLLAEKHRHKYLAGCILEYGA